METKTGYVVTSTSGSQSFGSYFGDAQRFAMRQAIVTGEKQWVKYDEKVIVAYSRGKSGLAAMTNVALY